MFDIGLQEMMLIGVIALLVFGPSKLPELGRMLGRAMRELRRASDEFRSTVETNLHINDLDPVPSSHAVETPVEAPVTSGTESSVSEGQPVSDTATTQDVSLASAEPAEPFCAQRGSRLFHRHECTWVARITEVDRVYFKSVADARDQGFVTCPVCEPWEPS